MNTRIWILYHLFIITTLWAETLYANPLEKSLFRALELQTEGKPDSAAYYYESIIDTKTSGREADSIKGLAYAHYGDLLRKTSNLQMSKRVLDDGFAFAAEKLPQNYLVNSFLYEFMGKWYFQTGNAEEADHWLRKSLDLSILNQPDSSEIRIAKLMGNIIQVALRSNNREQAVSLLYSSIRLKEKLLEPDDPRLAYSYEQLALYSFDLGDLLTANDYLVKAVEIREKKPEYRPGRLVEAYNNLGSIYQSLDRNNLAKKYLQKSLRLANEINYKSAVAYSLGNLGYIYLDEEDYSLARKCLFSSLDIRLNANQPEPLGDSYYLVGRYYYLNQKPDSALLYFRKGLPRAGKDNLYTTQAIICNAMGRVHLEDLGNKDSALFWFQQAAIKADINDWGFQLEHHLNLGEVYRLQKDWEKAQSEYDQAYDISSELVGAEHSYTLMIEGLMMKLLFEKGANEDAEQFGKDLLGKVGLSKATNLPNKDKFPTKVFAIEWLNLYADILRAKAKNNQNAQVKKELLFEALDWDVLATKLIERYAGKLTTELAKKEFLKKNSQQFEETIEHAIVLYRKYNDASLSISIFSLFERFKAIRLKRRILLAQLAGGDPLVAALQDAEAQKSYFENGRLKSAKKFDQYKNPLIQLNVRIDSLNELLEQRSSGFQMQQLPALDLYDIQGKLASQELLIQCFWGKEDVYFLYLNQDSININSIPTSTIRSWTSTLSTIGDGPAISDSPAWKEANHKLGEAIFYDKSIFSKIELICFIPDGPLGQIPLEMLYLKSDMQEVNSQSELIDRFCVRYAYSSTQAFEQFNPKKGNNFTVFAGFAPTYPLDSIADMPYSQTPKDNLSDYFRNQNIEHFSPLYFNRAEIEAVGPLLGGKVFVDSFAQKKYFTQKAENYGILHLAMHAFADPQNPNYSALVFPPTAGDSVYQYLYAFEIQQMHFNAQLTVLSACETGKGIYEEGEGIRSLAYAFQYAGSPNVVMSHWQVNDQMMAELMVEYYELLSQGVGKASALRQAKLTYRQKHPEDSPFLWASLIHVGDDQPLEFTQASLWKWFMVTLVLLIILFVIGYAIRRDHT